MLDAEPLVVPQYVEVARFDGRLVLAAAARVGGIRLIDNVTLEGGARMSIRQHQPAPAVPAPGKLTVPELAEMKRRGDPIVMVTAYDATGGRLADAAGVDLILVGDTAAMVVLGHESSTVPVTMDEMLFMTRAVTRGARRPLVVGDMPFGSYQVSDEDAVRNAIRFIKEAGADVIKLEGAGPSLSRVAVDRRRGHPGHGPHRADAAVGDQARRLQGAGTDAPRRRVTLWEEARRAGGGRLLRARARGRARPRSPREITAALSIPTIGIGAGAGCDGQVLVWHDLLGPVRRPHAAVREAVRRTSARRSSTRSAAYAADVRSRRFPAEEHTYGIPDEELDAFRAAIGVTEPAT